MGTICYLIQAYNDEKAFKLLCNKLLKMGDCEIFVHLDLKSDYNKFRIDNEKIHFIANRLLVSWAGYNQGKLILNLIENVILYNKKFDEYVFLSESDYPVYSKDFLFDKIKKCNPIMLNCSKEQPNKIEKYWFYDFGIKSAFLNKILSHGLNMISELLYRTNILKKSNKLIIDGKMVDVYFSGPFWRYTYEQLYYIDKCFKRNPSIEKYFRYSFAPCELIISTIIANSDYKNDCIFKNYSKNLENMSSLCYFKYNGPRVNVLTVRDYEDIIFSGKPFIRKVNEKSRGLLELLEKDE